MRLLIGFSLLGILACSTTFLAPAAAPDRTALVEEFVRGYRQLNMPPLRLAYVENLENIPDAAAVARQRAFFARFATRLEQGAQPQVPSTDERTLSYEIELNLRRLDLEERWLANRPNTVPTGGLGTFAAGREWYVYFLQKWVSLDAQPDTIFAFGLREIARVQAEMRKVRKRSGLDSTTFVKALQKEAFFLPDAAAVQAYCEEYQRAVIPRLRPYFPAWDSIPPPTITAGTNSALAATPGYYRRNTFYFNIFGQAWDRRQVGWLYLHEGMPGHHYQLSYTRRFAPASPLTELFPYSVFGEGYAAYIEDLALELGAYRDDYEVYSKWEWDLIRSIRVSLDVGLNYYGWSDARALAFWQKYLRGKDDIAAREIARMRRWPAQVVTYKYGADRIMRWRRTLPELPLREFHRRLLAHGPLPLSILEPHLLHPKSS
ncbi:MAG: DUF885 family protein [Bacteroidota bacterium]